MSAISAVTFDLWQTLLLDDPEVGRRRTQARLEGAQEALLRAGEAPDAGSIEKAYHAGIRRCQEIRAGLIDISFSQQVELFVNSISPGLASRLTEATFQAIARAYRDAFFEYPPIPHPEGVGTLRKVQEMGFSLGLISNTGMTPGEAFRSFMDQHGMLDYFSALIFSDEVKVAKPSPEIFRMALNALNALPSQAIHVGDHFHNDVIGAKQCGLRAVWIEGFYPRPDSVGPEVEPDEAVGKLRLVPAAIRELAGRAI